MLVALSVFMLAAPAPTPACVQELSELLQREDFDATLTAAERCETETGHPRSHYFAGIAHLASHHPERAVGSLQRYLDSDPADEPPRLRELAAARLEQARTELGTIVIQVAPRFRDGDVRVTIQRPAGEPPIIAFLSELDQKDDHAILLLPPGKYAITAARVGHLPGRQEFSIAAAGDTVSVFLPLMLRPPPPKLIAPEPPKFPSRVWAGAWGGIAGGVVVVGVPVIAGATAQMPGFCPPHAQAIDNCRSDAAKWTMVQAGGSGMLGAGVGFMIGGLTGLAPVDRTRRVAWAAETGVGGALATVGVVLLAVAQRSFNQVNNSTDPTAEPWGPRYDAALAPSSRNFMAGAALLGTGVGLAVSAALGLASPKFLHKSPATTARWGVQPDGFSVQF